MHRTTDYSSVIQKYGLQKFNYKLVAILSDRAVTGMLQQQIEGGMHATGLIYTICIGLLQALYLPLF